jgi:Zn finger protein HypA/HybF involved in hydrogenase expression
MHDIIRLTPLVMHGTIPHGFKTQTEVSMKNLDDLNLIEMSQAIADMVCKQCGRVLEDYQESGYCSPGCEEVHEKIRELDERFARQEGV